MKRRGIPDASPLPVSLACSSPTPLSASAVAHISGHTDCAQYLAGLIKVERSVPSAPSAPTCVSRNPHHLTWGHEPDDPRVPPVRLFELRWCKKTPLFRSWKTVKATTSSCHVDLVDGNVALEVQVRAVNANGASKWSKRTVVAPQAPVSKAPNAASARGTATLLASLGFVEAATRPPGPPLELERERAQSERSGRDLFARGPQLSLKPGSVSMTEHCFDAALRRPGGPGGAGGGSGAGGVGGTTVRSNSGGSLESKTATTMAASSPDSTGSIDSGWGGAEQGGVAEAAFVAATVTAPASASASALTPASIATAAATAPSAASAATAADTRLVGDYRSLLEDMEAQRNAAETRVAELLVSLSVVDGNQGETVSSLKGSLDEANAKTEAAMAEVEELRRRQRCNRHCPAAHGRSPQRPAEEGEYDAHVVCIGTAGWTGQSGVRRRGVQPRTGRALTLLSPPVDRRRRRCIHGRQPWCCRHF